MGRLLQGQRRVLRRPRQPRRRRQDGHDQEGPPLIAALPRRSTTSDDGVRALRPAGLPLGLARSAQGAGESLPARTRRRATASPTSRSAPRRQHPGRRPGRCARPPTPGLPQTYGTPPLREAVSAWFARRRGAPDVDPDGVLPTIGSKELVAWLPTLLGIGAGESVVFPTVAYPTYDVGARIAGRPRCRPTRRPRWGR
ncbi:aminotransferase class I/II-fold pyridoxal phosphate-dependent enzyme [Janibacter melonis]|uniref:aminotransferase class I/II-fold pyridoxal phosphate-dependent enzyme n=1 Tax=Janibacter melonis TaxID=262209 RepID=UPI0027D9ECAB|nr:aminotransferase class I/II-fold pyridoxal phosphate-dependent enzyme [Janibacter melonis]